MCGIIGSWSLNISSDNCTVVSAGMNLLTHRGPNDRGLHDFRIKDGQLVFGQTRLSIIDLSTGGHQPMISADGRWALIFNGEIYNYRELHSELQELGVVFLTESDTEVLLYSWIEWGEACLSRLCGMFAFAVCDTLTGVLTCARDAFGIKPFYYYTTSDRFVFASEIPALLSLLPRNPDFNAQRVSDYLVYGSYDDSGETFFAGVTQLCAGNILTLNLRGNIFPVVNRWWWPSIIENKDISFDEAVSTLRSMFLESVQLHLRSDVALGAALSGGIDSSAVVCAMRHLQPDLPIHTFSYIPNDARLSEERWIDVVNAHVGAVAHKVKIADHSLIEDLDQLVEAQGEPFGGTSIYAQYCVFAEVQKQGVVVTLDGQGADEVLAGYDGYPAQRIRSLLESGQFARAFGFLRSWSALQGRSGVGASVSAMFSMLPRGLQRASRQILRGQSIPVWLKPKWFSSQGVDCGHVEDPIHGTDERGRRVVAALRATLTGRGMNALLRHGDRNSMRFSVESRVPFLTLGMAEFLLTLPEHYLISDAGQTKHIFREAMRGIVPDVILDRQDKIGFATPELDLLTQCNSQTQKWLEAADSKPFLDAEICRRELSAMLDRTTGYKSEMWRLINFCRWSQRMTQFRRVQPP